MTGIARDSFNSRRRKCSLISIFSFKPRSGHTPFVAKTIDEFHFFYPLKGPEASR